MSEQELSPAPVKAEVKPNRLLVDIRNLARVLRQFELTEIEVEKGDTRIRVSRTLTHGNGTHVVASLPQTYTVPVPATETMAPIPTGNGDAKKQEQGNVIVSPFVGTFYRAPGPDASPFVDVGSTVKKGQTLCIVEAMKLMNEIEAEMDCKILEILAGNADPVEYGQALFRVQPL